MISVLDFSSWSQFLVSVLIDYLARTQNNDGSWTEHEITGTGFPKVFYLKYDMYRNAWPLLALATYRNLLDRVDVKTNVHVNGSGTGQVNGHAQRVTEGVFVK